MKTLSEADRPGSRTTRWSPAQLESILAAVSDGVTVQDRHGAVVYANDAACRLLGVSDANALLSTDAPIMARFRVFDESGKPFPPEKLPGRRALEGEVVPEILLRFEIPGTQESRWARVAARPIRGQDGSIELAVNTFRDVTAWVVAEQRIKFGADLLDEVEAAIVATDARGNVTHWNRAAAELYGWAREFALGRPAAELGFPTREAAGRDVAGAGVPVSATLRDVIDGRPWEGEVVVRRPDGRETVAYVVLNPLRQSGTAAGSVGVAVDATAQRRTEAELRISEERYRTLANSLPHIVVTAGPDGTFERANRRFDEYAGMSLAEAAESSWAGIVHPDDRERLNELRRTAIETGTEIEAEYRLRRADGVYRWHMLRMVPLRASDGSIVAWIGTSTDVEESKRAERGLAFLAEASRALSSSLDYEETLASVAALAVPQVADWCRVDLLNADGRLDVVAVAHVDPAKVEIARDLNRRYPTDPASSRGVGAVLRTGRSQLVAEISDSMLAEQMRDPELLDVLRELGLRSSMIVPLLARGRPIGAISFVAAESGRHFDAVDLALAEDLARRAATAIENAQLYRRVSEFKGAVDNATDSVYMYDPRTLQFDYVNRAAVEQVGYTAGELLGMTPLDLKPEYDETRYRALIAPLVRGELPSRRFQTVQRRKDGTTYPVDVVLQRLTDDTKDDRIIAFVRDVSERVATQERLRTLARAERARAAEVVAVIRAMGEAVIVFDAQGCVTLANPAAEVLLPTAAHGCYADLAGLFEVDSSLPQLGLDRQQGPHELRLRGERRWLELTSYPVLVEPHETAGAGRTVHVGDTIFVMRDVTDQREQEAMREAFIGVLSHELRTPVTTIYGSSKVLRRLDGRLSEEARRDVYGDIEAESERLYRLVEDLLVLARFGEEPVRLGDEPVLLQRILPTVVASERGRWPETQFVTEMPVGLPTVRADQTYVEQVARNLLANGAKYGRRGGRVLLHLEARPDEVEVSVRDDGPGFPPEEADRLFELFYRSPLTAAHAPGAGIGLFVARRLIEAMGGRIWARNVDGGGAEFGFTLARFHEDE